MKENKHFIAQLIEDKEKFIFKCLKGEMDNTSVWTIVWYSIAGLGIYGFTLGFIHSWQQALASTIKVPLIFYISSGVCFPTLYLFLSLLGIKYPLKGILSFGALCMFFTSVGLMAFAPLSFFFVITGKGYMAFRALNVIFMAVSGFSGVFIFRKYLLTMIPENWEDVYIWRTKAFIILWLMMYAYIGATCSVAISPVFGDPSADFIWFTVDSGSFLDHLLSN